MTLEVPEVGFGHFRNAGSGLWALRKCPKWTSGTAEVPEVDVGHFGSAESELKALWKCSKVDVGHFGSAFANSAAPTSAISQLSKSLLG